MVHLRDLAWAATRLATDQLVLAEWELARLFGMVYDIPQ